MRVGGLEPSSKVNSNDRVKKLKLSCEIPGNYMGSTLSYGHQTITSEVIGTWLAFEQLLLLLCDSKTCELQGISKIIKCILFLVYIFFSVHKSPAHLEFQLAALKKKHILSCLANPSFIGNFQNYKTT
jgi:hypothetical protein